MEVVVEVARADAEFVGNFQGGYVGFALLVEQLQGAFKDTVAGLHPVSSSSGQHVGAWRGA
ncbi:hypothetical protein D3C71_1868350 [compost metagenome]